MKKARGKKGKYLIYPDNRNGLVEDYKWKGYLDKYPDGLIRQIRLKLAERLPGLSEKFNHNSKYFGYRVKDEKDRVYIYVQKKNLVIDLHIKPSYVNELEKEGFIIKPRDNFQGQNGWLTGWKVPQSTTDVDPVVNWLCKAFESNL